MLRFSTQVISTSFRPTFFMPANAMDYSNTEVPVYKASSNVSIARCMAAWMQGRPMEAKC